MDGITTAQVKAGAEEFLNALRAQLKDCSYQPGPVNRAWLPKADGKQRPLGIPNVSQQLVPWGERPPGVGREAHTHADDFVLLCRPGSGGAMLERLRKYVQAKRLTLNEAKTRLVNFQQDAFRFLGFDFAWRRSPRTGNRFVHVEPSPKARLHLRDAIRDALNHQRIRLRHELRRGAHRRCHWRAEPSHQCCDSRPGPGRRRAHARLCHARFGQQTTRDPRGRAHARAIRRDRRPQRSQARDYSPGSCHPVVVKRQLGRLPEPERCLRRRRRLRARAKHLCSREAYSARSCSSPAAIARVSRPRVLAAQIPGTAPLGGWHRLTRHS